MFSSQSTGAGDNYWGKLIVGEEFEKFGINEKYRG